MNVKEENAILIKSVLNWCIDCELQTDCIAPNLKPCDLKPAYDIAMKATTKTKGE